MRAKSLVLAGALAASLPTAAPAAAQGGQIQELDVRLAYGPGHWDGTPEADLLGSLPPSANPLVIGDVLEQTGWWVRIEGTDTREYPLGAPDSESWGTPSAAQATATWTNLRGTGLDASEDVSVRDLEGPSGTFSSRLIVSNSLDSARTVHVYHLVDADPAGLNPFAPFPEYTAGYRAGQIQIVSGSHSLWHRLTPAWYATLRRQCGPRTTMLALLNDGQAQDLDGTGLVSEPTSSGVACVQQATLTLDPHTGVAVTARVASNLRSPYTRGDVDDDLAADISFSFTTSIGERWWSWIMRHGSQLRSTIASDLSPGWKPVALNDFDHDGRSDLLVQRFNLSRIECAVWLSSGGPLATLQGQPVYRRGWVLAATADFDRDGNVDLLWRNTQTLQLVVWKMAGTARVGDLVPQPSQAVDANWEVVGADDLNGDGFVDLAWYNTTSGRAVIWWLDADLQRIGATFTDPPAAGDANWRIMAIGDFGKGALPGAPGAPPDLVWRNTTSGRVVIWFMDWQGRRTSGAFASPNGSVEGLFAPR